MHEISARTQRRKIELKKYSLIISLGYTIPVIAAYLASFYALSSASFGQLSVALLYISLSQGLLFYFICRCKLISSVLIHRIFIGQFVNWLIVYAYLVFCLNEMRMVMLIFSFMPLIFLSLNASFKTSIAITASAILVYEITAKLGIHFFAQYKPNFPEQFYELAYIPAAFFVAFITHEVKKLRDRVSLMKQQFEIAHRELEFTHKALEQAHNDVEDKNTALELLASKLAKYLSPQIYASIFSGEKDVIIETYKKNLTVFFSDIVGFSKKTEAMELEQLPDWLNQYLDEMAAVAIRYGGTLDKFIGDAVMVFFGDPQTEGEENDAVKCVKMAIEMQKQAKKIGMNIRIGINSGECLVGNFGSDLHMEYTIIGSAVNLAARLESHCEAGEILISQASYRLVKDQIACVKHGGIQVKGFDQSVMTYGIKKGDDKKA